jgi:hypothetical protein
LPSHASIACPRPLNPSVLDRLISSRTSREDQARNGKEKAVQSSKDCSMSPCPPSAIYGPRHSLRRNAGRCADDAFPIRGLSKDTGPNRPIHNSVEADKDAEKWKGDISPQYNFLPRWLKHSWLATCQAVRRDCWPGVPVSTHVAVGMG